MQNLPGSHAEQCEIVRFSDLVISPELIARLDDIFFEASATQSFDSDEQREIFRERWLGRYLDHLPDHAFLALDARGSPVGYVVGDLDDPAMNTRYEDIPYVQAFAATSRRFPAHLHINLAPGLRSRGLGSRLMEAFVQHTKAHGAPGLHVVTSKGSRNVAFYQRNGFRLRQEFDMSGRQLVLLGRDLAGSH